MIRSAEIIGDLRVELRRIWNDVAQPRLLTWLMLNPSTADGSKDDPTLLRIIKWAKLWGYDGLIVVNLFPFRSSSPEEMSDWYAAGNYTVSTYNANLEYILNAIEESRGEVMAAWGGSLPKTAKPGGTQVFMKQIEIMTFGTDYPVKWQCLGVSKAGHPIHPMARGRNRIPDDVQPVAFARAA